MVDRKIKVYGSNKYISFLSNRPRKGEYHRCETCSQEFYISPAYIRKAHKKGHIIRYCSMACYDKKGDKNPFWGKTFSEESLEKLVNNPNRVKFKTGEDNPNFIRFGEKYGYVGSSKKWWTRKLLNEIGKCELCGFSDKRALCIHHSDKNSSNNIRENLILLCWNCHQIWHYNDASGIYSNLIKDKYSRNVG